MEYARPFPEARAIGLDCETTGLEFYNLKHHLELITLSDGNETLAIRTLTYQPNWVDQNIFDRIVIAHNAGFDLPWVNATFDCGYPKQVWDTLVAEQLLTAGTGEKNDLASVAQRRLGVELSKELQTSFDGKELTREQIEYAEMDAKVLVPLARVQHQLIQQEGLQDIWEIERQVTPIFCQMNGAGIRVDRAKLERLITDAKQNMERLECRIVDALSPYIMPIREARFNDEQASLDSYLRRRDAAFADFGGDKQKEKSWRQENPRPKKPELDLSPININSRDQVLAALAQLGIELKDYTETTLSYATMRDDVPANIKRDILTPLLEYKKVAKRVQAFGDGLLDRIQPNERVYSTFKQLGTVTGRPSSSEPNILNMPSSKTFRSVFIPDDGNVMIVADYSQMELRILAELSKDPSMIQMFVNGEDLHTNAAREIFSTQKPTDDQRKAAKRFSLGIPYGTSAFGMQQQLQAEGIDMPRMRCDEIITHWKEKLFPVAWAKLSAWQSQAYHHGTAESALGRKRYFPKPKGGREISAVKREGGNYPMQSTNADITKIAMIMVDEVLRQIGGRIVLNVYDEIVCEVPQPYAQWAADAVTTCMKEAAKVVLKTVPVEVDCTVSSSWAE